MAGYIGSAASVVSSGAENKKVFDITTNTTSLTGLNYTVGKVHVYHNGVRLVDGTDYTATNSTSITLTVAAASGDQVVVVSYASFQLSEHYTKAETDILITGADSTPSITDNGNATALTIDSSEHVMVGTAVSTGFQSSSSATGTIAYSHGSIASNTSGDAAAYFNRLVSDGDIAQFKKNGATVGSIGTASGVAQYSGSSYASFGAGDVGLFANPINNALYPGVQTTLSASDGLIDLGITSNRFKDLYLSGGVYLGGTGSANKLDDYETGTWTPSLGGNAVYDIQTGHYVKVGGLVYASFAIRPTSLGTGYAGAILGLPFPSSDFVGISVGYYDGAATSHLSILGGASGNQINLYLKTSATNDTYNSTIFFQNNARIYGQATYRTTA